jgi:hypothetical protein
VLLEKSVSAHAQNAVPVSPVIDRATDIPTAVAIVPLAFHNARPTGSATPAIGAPVLSAIAPATTSQGVDLSLLTALEGTRR